MESKGKWAWLDWAATLIFMLGFFGCWISAEHNLLPYGNMMFFVALMLLFLNHVDWIDKLKNKDRELYILLGGGLLAAVNMVWIRSNLGAIFTIADFLLLLYLADKIVLPKKCIWTLAGSCGVIAVYWILVKRAEYGQVSLNPNTVGCVVFSTLYLIIAGVRWCLDWDSEKNRRVWDICIIAGSVLIVFMAFRMRARSALLAALVVLFAYYVLPKQKWTIYLVLGINLLFPVAYIWMWKMGINPVIPILNKPFISGRERIWPQFWNAFIKHPISGIGSNFEYMVPDAVLMEVHHALLDLLFVHGIFVFLIVMYFLIKRFGALFEEKRHHGVADLCISILYGMFAIGTFENYQIVAPYSIVFFLVLVLGIQSERQRGI